MMLEFLGEKLSWRLNEKLGFKEVRDLKQLAMENPEQHLWIETREMMGVRAVFNHLRSLTYTSKPDYALIAEQLKNILLSEVNRGKSLINQFL